MTKIKFTATTTPASSVAATSHTVPGTSVRNLGELLDRAARSVVTAEFELEAPDGVEPDEDHLDALQRVAIGNATWLRAEEIAREEGEELPERPPFVVMGVNRKRLDADT